MLKKNYVFVLLCIFIIVSCTFGQTQSTDQKEKVYKWIVVSVYPERIPIFNDGIKKFANDIRVISNGQLDIKFYPAKKYIDDKEKTIEPRGVFKAVSEGTVEMGFGAPIYWASEVPGCEFMYAVPFGLGAVDMHAWLYRGGGLELWKELFAIHNLIPFPMGATGGAMGGWFRNEIKTIDDFKGLKIRIDGFGAKTLEKLGAKPDWMIADETLDAYNNSRIDAIVCQGPYHDQHHEFYRATKNYYYPGWQEPGGLLALIINKHAWENLPPHLQEMIKIVRSSIDQHIYNQFMNMDSYALKQLLEQNDVKLFRFPDNLLDEIKRISIQVLEENSQNNEQFRRVYKAFKEFQKHDDEFEWDYILDDAVSQKRTSLRFIKKLGDFKFASIHKEKNNSVIIELMGDEISEINRIAKSTASYVDGISSITIQAFKENNVSVKRGKTIKASLLKAGIDASLIKTTSLEKAPEDPKKKDSTVIIIEF